MRVDRVLHTAFLIPKYMVIFLCLTPPPPHGFRYPLDAVHPLPGVPAWWCGPHRSLSPTPTPWLLPFSCVLCTLEGLGYHDAVPVLHRPCLEMPSEAFPDPSCAGPHPAFSFNTVHIHLFVSVSPTRLVTHVGGDEQNLFLIDLHAPSAYCLSWPRGRTP